MAISCPRCGRGYDVSLFQFGRTITCPCGAGVTRESPGGPAQRHGDHRFAADAMLGRLARWLRLLGYDTAYAANIEDAALVHRALREGRVLLTRDRGLLERWRPEHHLLIKSAHPLCQLRQVVEDMGLVWKAPRAPRCTICNLPLLEAIPSEVLDEVPAHIARTHHRFARCPRCRRVYWEGTHMQRMRATLEKTLGADRDRPPAR